MKIKCFIMFEYSAVLHLLLPTCNPDHMKITSSINVLLKIYFFIYFTYPKVNKYFINTFLLDHNVPVLKTTTYYQAGMVLSVFLLLTFRIILLQKDFFIRWFFCRAFINSAFSLHGCPSENFLWGICSLKKHLKGDSDILLCFVVSSHPSNT